jgi:hypothetical protein
MSVSFLLQVTRILHKGNYDENELFMVYDYLKTIDNEVIIEYNYSSTVLSYDTDLDLFIEILDKTILILEDKEEYEKCQILQNKKNECIIIKNKI